MLSRLFTLLAAFAFACGEGTDHGHDHEHEHDAEGEHAHEHVAPHGGILVPIGEEFAHVEFTLDPQSGRLTAYCLDHCAENPVRIATGTLDLDVVLDSGVQRVVLEGVTSVLTGETRGDTSQFSAEVPQLKGADSFQGTLRSITILGSTVVDLPIPPTD